MSIHDHREQVIKRYAAARLSDDYRLHAYMVWYNAGKPSYERLLKFLDPDPASGVKPSPETMRQWVLEIFIPLALELDDQVTDTVNKVLLNQRIEMLDRHAVIAKELQDMAMDYLREHGLGNSKNALVALINSVKMEHDARIVPTDILAKLSDMSDEKLLGVFTDMLNSGDIIDISANTDAIFDQSSAKS